MHSHFTSLILVHGWTPIVHKGKSEPDNLWVGGWTRDEEKPGTSGRLSGCGFRKKALLVDGWR